MRLVPLEHEYHHHNRHRHNSESESATSHRRPRRKVRFHQPESSRGTDVYRSSGHRYSSRYSNDGEDRIVEQGYVIPATFPGMHPVLAHGTQAKPDQASFQRHQSGPAYHSKPKQRPQHIDHRAGSYIPQLWRSPIFVPIYEDDETRHRPEQWSRTPYNPRANQPTQRI